MGLKCRPNQRAWIDVPRTAENERWGFDRLHGHVVTTLRVVTAPELAKGTVMTDGNYGACWVVDPPQVVRFPAVARMPFGELPGMAVGELIGVPDDWLRPFDDLPAEDVDALFRELQQDAVL